ELVVAPGVVVTMARVDDVAQRLALRQRLHRLDHLVAHRGGPGVDHQHALIRDLHRDVAAGAGKHVDVALHGQDLDFTRRGRLELRRPVGTRGARRRLTSAPLRIDGNDENDSGECSQRRPAPPPPPPPPPPPLSPPPPPPPA